MGAPQIDASAVAQNGGKLNTLIAIVEIIANIIKCGIYTDKNLKYSFHISVRRKLIFAFSRYPTESER